MSTIPQTALYYGIKLGYDFDMSLIVANLTNDGILISSDKRGIGMDMSRDTPEKIIKDDIQKIFIEDGYAWGMAGKSILTPSELRDYLSNKGVLSPSDDLKRTANNIVKSIDEANRLGGFNKSVPVIILCAIRNGEQIIYLAALIDGKLVLLDESAKLYGSIGMTEVADSKLRSVFCDGKDDMKRRHIEVIRETSDSVETVGRICDHVLIGYDGSISSLEQ